MVWYPMKKPHLPRTATIRIRANKRKFSKALKNATRDYSIKSITVIALDSNVAYIQAKAARMFAVVGDSRISI